MARGVVLPVPSSRPDAARSRGLTRRTVFAALGALPLAACLPRRAPAEEQPATSAVAGSITYAFLGNPVFYQMNQEAAAEFERAFPNVKVELAYLPEGMYDKIQAMYSGNVSPDVWEPDAARFPSWAERDSFLTIDAYVKRDQGKGFDLNDIWPNLRRSAEYKGKLLGVLCRYTVNAMFYNEDLLDRHGIPYPSEQWTVSELVVFAQKITDVGAGIWGFGRGFWNHWLWAFGGEILEGRDGRWRSAMGSPKSIEALQWMQDLHYRYRVSYTAQQRGGLSDIQLFINGRVAYADQRVTRVADIRAAEASQLRWDVSWMPKGPAGRFAWGIGVNRCISSQTRNPETAWQFVKFLFSKPEIATISIPPNMSYAYSPKFLNTGQPPRTMKAFLDAIAYSKDYPNEQGRWPELEVIVNRELNRLWNNEASAREAGEAIDKAVNVQLDQWGQLMR
jgi:multiple sugar transport system substrate-binding protein